MGDTARVEPSNCNVCSRTLDDIQLHLKRPAYLYPEDRLDRLLARKAAEGVQIFITLYKEVGGAVPLESYYTKCTLKRCAGRPLDGRYKACANMTHLPFLLLCAWGSLHPNIHVVRHPDHRKVGGTLFWAHHEKMVMIDNVCRALAQRPTCTTRTC